MSPPRFNQVNIVARDWQATLAFYRLVGLDLDGGAEWPPASGAMHANASTHAGVTTIEFDNPPMLRIWASEQAAEITAVLGFAFDSAAEVDAACDRVAAAGHRVLRAPYDAFWGARYAIVQDPSGNAVGFMGPRDRARGYVPSVPAGEC
jgi:uncharacterized glyoxalase superfamily protein PhnB